MKTSSPVRRVPRVLVLTPDPGIVFGLSFRLSARLSVRAEVGGVDELLDVDVVVLDLTGRRPDVRYGTMVERFARHGVRVVVLADEPLDLPPARVVRRPFKLKQLADAIREALATPAVQDADASSGSGSPLTRGDSQQDLDLVIDLTDEHATPSVVATRPATSPDMPPAARWQPTAVHHPVVARRRARWARRHTATDAEPRDMHQRLAGFVPAAEEIERLVTEIPLVRSLPALLRAIARSVADELGADTVALWRADRHGWSAAAHVGLTALEAKTLVAFDQPMLREVDASGGAMLMDPIERVQAAVAGIGGAHTRSFMAASIAAGAARHGVITAGREAPFVVADLDHLADLASEAALGVAVAEHLQRVGALMQPPPDPLASPSGLRSEPRRELFATQGAGAATQHQQGGDPDERPHDQYEQGIEEEHAGDLGDQQQHDRQHHQ